MDRVRLITDLTHNRERVLARLDESEETLARTYGPGKWSARELLAHIADIELVNLWRFLRATAEPGSHVEPFSETAWAERLDYRSRPIDVSRRLFDGSRAMLLHSLETMSEVTLRGACGHAEKGDLTGFDWADLALGHAEHHLGQVDAACDGIAWSPVPRENAWRFGAAAPPPSMPGGGPSARRGTAE